MKHLHKLHFVLKIFVDLISSRLHFEVSMMKNLTKHLIMIMLAL